MTAKALKVWKWVLSKEWSLDSRLQWLLSKFMALTLLSLCSGGGAGGGDLVTVTLKTSGR